MGRTREVVENHYGKIATALITSFLLYAIPTTYGMIRSSIVLASDLDAVVQKLGEEVKKQLAPIVEKQNAMAAQQEKNSLSICTGRKATLKNAIRSTNVQIQDMKKDKATKPAQWTPRDEQLLGELQADLEQSLEEYNTLACKGSLPPTDN